MRQCWIDINHAWLVRDMIEMFYEQLSLRGKLQEFSWSLGSRDLPTFLTNFVRTHDVFHYTSNGPSVVVDTLSYSYHDPYLNVVLDVAWQAPMITLKDLPSVVQPGEEYLIVPRLYQPSYSGQMWTSESPFDDCQFSIAHGTPLVLWDARFGGFRMTAPRIDVEVSGPTMPITSVG